ncbi:trypsin-like serine peptidase [Oharaeibacter diazotrophicus]|uniref:Trypsin-like peptidase n=1 Tax=Oharaeibacter diazotrophicus TaxID=1920512 RepID=A0A4V3CVV3_9HYPH|nr:serine protease [Oharaeibacter diazotrophicus]TDP83918.1 trypsin-like peptidase [Oharaeibacter diazotrophicus]BBE72959.1 hypothetical protein OHA_1_02564 [Pleomorphomonas sp. SM30]GLS74739.1 hypothetical protein GCM10007904_00740 [Oharaeibacter diazotrophicus]
MGVTKAIPRIIETTLLQLSAPSLVVGSLTAGFLLCLFSTSIGGHDVSYEVLGNKQIGMLFAPNWTFVYMVLFPLYLYCFSVIATSRASMTAYMVEEGLITGPRGVRTTLDVVETAWLQRLEASGPIFAFLLVGVAASSGFQWYHESYLPFVTGSPPNSPPDWGNFHYIPPPPHPKEYIGVFAYTSACYLYMAIVLFIFLALLYYVALFASFLRTTAQHDGMFRLIYHTTGLSTEFYKLVRYIFFITILGLCAAYAMRLQSLYLGSNYTHIKYFMFSEFFPTGDGVAPSQKSNYSAGTSLGVAVYTLLVAGLSVSMIWSASADSRSYYLQRIGDADWRRSAHLGYDKTLVDAIRGQTFLRAFLPKYAWMTASIACLCLAIVWADIGSLFVLSLAFALLALKTVHDEPTPSLRIAHRPTSLRQGDRAALLGILSKFANTNSPEIIDMIVRDASIPEEIKSNIQDRLKTAQHKISDLLDLASQQGTVPGERASVLGFLIVVVVGLVGADIGCSLYQIAANNQLMDKPLLDGIRLTTCNIIFNYSESKDHPDSVETIMRAEIKHSDLLYLAEILADTALNSGRPKQYFDDLLIRANIPPRFRHISVGRFDGPMASSNFVSWAISQGKNPRNTKQATLASLLLPVLGDLSFDNATWIAALLIAYDFVVAEDEAELRRRFTIPVVAVRSVPAPVAENNASHGPDFTWQGDAEYEQLQAILRPNAIGIDVGFLTCAARASRSICRIEIGDRGAVGTGFLIRPDIIATCYHVFGRDDLEVRRNISLSRLQFGAISTDTSNDTVQYIPLAGAEILSASAIDIDDYIMLRIEVGDFNKFVLPISESPLGRGGSINILHHPRGIAMQLDISPSGITWLGSNRTQYICNAQVGSSGAPCFDDQWNVVALHHAMRTKAFGVAGEGIPINKISQKLG